MKTVNLTETGWDKAEVHKLMELGISREDAWIALGRISEHRQMLYLQGYHNGYNAGRDVSCRDEQPGVNLPG